MKTLQSVRRSLFLVLVLSLGWASCTNPATDDASVAETSDVRYLVGTLASWESSSDSGQVVEDPAELLASDTAVAANLRSLETTGVVDNGDGTVTVTKAGNHWSGVYVTKVITRDKKPSLATVTAAGTVTQSATEYWYLGTSTSGIPFATITISMVWEVANGSVALQSLSRSGERVGFGTTTPHLLKISAVYTAGALTSKTVDHYAGSVSAANLLYTEVFEKFAASGSDAAYTKITRKKDSAVQNWRTITPSTGSPQTIKRYNSDDILRESAVRTKSDTGWSLTRTRYKIDGVTVKGSISESVTITVESNSTHMVREITADGVTRQVSLDVTVEGNEYTISKTIDGVEHSWTAVRGAGGTWTITPEGGAAVTVASDEVI